MIIRKIGRDTDVSREIEKSLFASLAPKLIKQAGPWAGDAEATAAQSGVKTLLGRKAAVLVAKQNLSIVDVNVVTEEAIRAIDDEYAKALYGAIEKSGDPEPNNEFGEYNKLGNGYELKNQNDILNNKDYLIKMREFITGANKAIKDEGFPNNLATVNDVRMAIIGHAVGGTPDDAYYKLLSADPDAKRGPPPRVEVVAEQSPLERDEEDERDGEPAPLGRVEEGVPPTAQAAVVPTGAKKIQIPLSTGPHYYAWGINNKGRNPNTDLDYAFPVEVVDESKRSDALRASGDFPEIEPLTVLEWIVMRDKLEGESPESGDGVFVAKDREFFDLAMASKAAKDQCEKTERGKGASEADIKEKCSEHLSKFQANISDRKANNLKWKEYRFERQKLAALDVHIGEQFGGKGRVFGAASSTRSALIARSTKKRRASGSSGPRPSILTTTQDAIALALGKQSDLTYSSMFTCGPTMYNFNMQGYGPTVAVDICDVHSGSSYRFKSQNQKRELENLYSRLVRYFNDRHIFPVMMFILNAKHSGSDYTAEVAEEYRVEPGGTRTGWLLKHRIIELAENILTDYKRGVPVDPASLLARHVWEVEQATPNAPNPGLLRSDMLNKYYMINGALDYGSLEEYSQKKEYVGAVPDSNFSEGWRWSKKRKKRWERAERAHKTSSLRGLDSLKKRSGRASVLQRLAGPGDEMWHLEPLKHRELREDALKYLLFSTNDSKLNDINREITNFSKEEMKKRADKFSDSYYGDVKKTVSEAYSSAYYAGLKSMYDEVPESVGKPDFGLLYNVHDEKGYDLIDSAHPNTIELADAMGNGGVVENSIEQSRSSRGVALSAPTGNYRSKHAWIVERLIKLAKNVEESGDVKTAKKINVTINKIKSR